MKSITSKEMKIIDDKLINEYGIQLMQMMENAGLSLAMLSAKVIDYKKNKKITLLIGKGNNGGGGLSCARHLDNFGYDVKVILAKNEIKKIPLKQLNILRKIKVPIYSSNIKISKYNINVEKIINNSDLIIDALLGYNSRGDPYDQVKELIKLANKSKNKILSLDIPSGLDPDFGKVYNPCIKAKYTLTLAYPKKGLMFKNAKKYTGKLYLSYLTIPKDLYKKFNIKITHDYSRCLFAYL